MNTTFSLEDEAILAALETIDYHLARGRNWDDSLPNKADLVIATTQWINQGQEEVAA